MRYPAICIRSAALSIVLSAGIATAAEAAPAAAKAATKPSTEPVAAKAVPSFAEMMKVINKLFPPQPDPDPARLALARTSAQSIWPDGAYGRMLTGLMGGMFDRVMSLKESDLGSMAPKKTTKVDPAKANLSLHDQLVTEDPYFDQRVAAMRAVLTEEVGKVSTIVDPRMRDGLARAMARRFDARQISDINAFFATPSGQALSSQYMQLWIDPDTIRSVFGTFPDMMKLMPGMMEKLQAANDKFPKPPKKDKDKPAKK